jgi:hypothetical protein
MKYIIIILPLLILSRCCSKVDNCVQIAPPSLEIIYDNYLNDFVDFRVIVYDTNFTQAIDTLKYVTPPFGKNNFASISSESSNINLKKLEDKSLIVLCENPEIKDTITHIRYNIEKYECEQGCISSDIEIMYKYLVTFEYNKKKTNQNFIHVNF